MTSFPNRGRRLGNRAGEPASVTDVAISALRSMIVDAQLPMGSQIREQALADELKIGRAALREGLRIAAQDGLVVHTPRAGFRVCQLSLQDAYEIVTLREHLENLVIQQAVPCEHEARIAPLQQAVDSMRDGGSGSPGDHSALEGVAYHQAFVALAGNRHLSAAFGTIAYPLGMLMHLNRSVAATTESPDERADRHQRLVHLVRGNDREAVAHELHAHPTVGFLTSGVLDESIASPAAVRWRAKVLA